ncbi:hypothetical protein L7F22_012952 [Adiantum nelumboides]|nr:hypothetical protein [Adiantum nelumboides]
MGLHEALLNGLSSTSPLNPLSMPPGPQGNRSLLKFPQEQGFPFAGQMSSGTFRSPRPPMLHAGGGRGSPFSSPASGSFQHKDASFSNQSFAEAIRGPPNRESHHNTNQDHNAKDGNAVMESVTINDSELEAWFSQLRERVVIGLCHGPRPFMEMLKQWIAVNLENRNVFPQHIQYLPNNFYLFFFEDANSALQVITERQWLIRNTPMSFFKWFKGFNPKGEKPTKIPVWVDFPDLPVEFYPKLNKIGNVVGKVLGQNWECCWIICRGLRMKVKLFNPPNIW